VKQPTKKITGPKTIPSQLTISGGIILKAMPFVIVAYNDDGTPKTFELRPPGPHDMKADGACVLFAQEEWIRSPQPGKAKAEEPAP